MCDYSFQTISLFVFLFPEANKEKILNNSNVDLDDSLPSDTSDTQTDTTNHQGDGDSTSVTDLLPERRSGDVEMGDLGAPSSRSRTSSDCSLEGVARGVGGDAEGGYSRIRNEDTISCSSEYFIEAFDWSAKNFALQPCWRLFVRLQIRSFRHLNKADTKQNIYLKDVILALLWGVLK